MGTLYVVATPIGNLEDITLRALRVLGEVSAIAAEDTRLTRRLLARHDLHTPLVSFHRHSSPGRRLEIVARLEAGDVALVSDAGTPGVSDPGSDLVRAAVAGGHRVVPVPGPSAACAALSASGLPADAYVFLGFLPRRARDRRALLAGLAAERRTLALYEAPHRLRASLDDLSAALGGGREVVVARELTKQFEELWRGSLDGARAHWCTIEPRGELTLVVAGAPEADARAEAWDDGRVRQALETERAAGVGAREAARRVAAAAGRSAREVYRLWEHAN